MKASMKSALDRVLERIEKVTESGCWIWMGAASDLGYGRIGAGGGSRRILQTHRVAYEGFVGPILSGLEIDHICRVPPCCNPTHLRAVTRRENQMAPGSMSPSKVLALKTHCPKGHEYTPQNTLRFAGLRRCRECTRAYKHGLYLRQKAARAAVILTALCLASTSLFAQAIGVPGQEWNPAFWQRTRQLVEHAITLKSNVEIVVIDTWLIKHCQWGDQPCTWPQEDVDAGGRRPSPEQERFIRKVVSELGCFSNVIWITDNEGGEIQGTKREWYEWVRSVIRDEEQVSGCGIVHLVGTNNTDFCDGPFDYCATHDRAPLTAPIAGKHTENNERNPDLGSPEAEHAAFCQAQAAGLHWWYWRAEQSTADMQRTLLLNSQGCGGPLGCFPPVEDDPLWVVPPVTGGGMSAEVRAAVDRAKVTVGERCGTDHAGSLTTLDLVGADLRKQGLCAGRSADSVFVLDGTLWKELHLVTFASGCWSQDPAQVPKSTWTYSGAPPAGTCPQDVPTVDQISCKLHQATNAIYDCTPKANGQPILPEGDPNRSACELKAMGGQWPVYSVSGGVLTVAPRENPMQFQLKGSGSGVVSCVVPVGTFCDLTVSQ